MLWKEWAGYYAVRSFDTSHEREYFAIRHAAGLLDVTPLYKYEVYGRDAGAFLARTMVRDVRKLKIGQVSYLCWCDDEGKVVDDGTVSRLEQDYYRVTAAEPTRSWFERHAHGYDLAIEDSSERLGALALQGPRSREILNGVSDRNLDDLRFFTVTRAKIDGVDVHVSRTGYTGDLGFEIWVAREQALRVWDAIMEAGQAHRIQPAGLDALDVTRLEAGFIMNGVDYHSAHHCMIESRKSSPYEIGLGWTVKLNRDPFVGQAALKAEKAREPRWAMVGLQLDWDEYESLFADYGLPPQVPAGAWRDPVPVFDSGGRQVGRATSGVWSPMLKSNLALASVEAAFRSPGTQLRIEVTVEYERRWVTAVVSKTPFFDPPRKRS